MARELPRILPSDTLTRGRVAEPDAPPGPSHEGDSVQILTDALRGINRDKLIAALVELADDETAAKKRQRTDSGNGGGDPPSVSPALVRRLGALAIVAITVIEPFVSQGAANIMSPRTEISMKLDEVLHEQAVTQSVLLSVVRWTIDLARQNGQTLPEMPPAVRLMLAEDEVARGTGP